MIYTDADTVLVGATEMRSNMPKLEKELKTKKIVVLKKGKPIAILKDYEDSEKTDRLLDEFEDIVLGFLAEERQKNGAKFVPHGDFWREVNGK